MNSLVADVDLEPLERCPLARHGRVNANQLCFVRNLDPNLREPVDVGNNGGRKLLPDDRLGDRRLLLTVPMKPLPKRSA